MSEALATQYAPAERAEWSQIKPSGPVFRKDFWVSGGQPRLQEMGDFLRSGECFSSPSDVRRML